MNRGFSEPPLKSFLYNGRTTGDGKLSRSAFYDHANIVGSYNDKFYEPDADPFGESISKGGSSPDAKHHIVWIDISEPAAAKLNSSTGAATDLLVFLCYSNAMASGKSAVKSITHTQTTN